MEAVSREKMMARLQLVGTSICGMLSFKPTSVPSLLMYSSVASSILRPTKMRMMPSPYFKYLKYLAIAASAKYSARSPRMAKMLLVSTMNGSRETLNTAGMESTAKATSYVSMTARATSRGVATRFPFSITKNFPSCIFDVTGRNRFKSLTTMLLAGSPSCSSSWLNILAPV